MNNYIDAHNHIVDKTPIKSLYNTISVIDVKNIVKVRNPLVAVGIHPEYLKSINDVEYVENILKDNPAFFVGEIGLDRRFNNRSLQLEGFNKFLSIANRYNRPISIHCVKEWGALLHSMSKGFNQDIPHIYHGFSGSLEVLKQLMIGNSFFSFSIRELTRVKLTLIIKFIPMNKILIESDMSIARYREIGIARYLDIVEESYKIISNIKMIPLDDVVNNIYSNFSKYIERIIE